MYTVYTSNSGFWVFIQCSSNIFDSFSIEAPDFGVPHVRNLGPPVKDVLKGGMISTPGDYVYHPSDMEKEWMDKEG